MSTYRPSTKPRHSMSVEELRYTLYSDQPPKYPHPENGQQPDLPHMRSDERPQDEHLDGRDMRFHGYRVRTLEQGGEYPDTMPQAIEATDSAGRQALYVPLSNDGKVVRSAGIIEALKRCGLMSDSS